MSLGLSGRTSRGHTGTELIHQHLLCGAAAGEDDGPHLVAETPSRHAGQEVRANVLSAIVTRPFLTGTN
jgi:hypothetical protein